MFTRPGTRLPGRGNRRIELARLSRPQQNRAFLDFEYQSFLSTDNLNATVELIQRLIETHSKMGDATTVMLSETGEFAASYLYSVLGFAMG